MAETDLTAAILAGLRRELSNVRFLPPGECDRAAQQAVEQLKVAPPEEAVAFVLTGLAVLREDRTWVGHALLRALSQVLRRKLPFSAEQVARMIDLVSVEHREFPFRGVLSAAAAVPLTPEIAEALGRLRPCLTEYLGGSEARDLRAAIDNLLHGPAPKTGLAVQGAWSRAVFEEIAGSAEPGAWEAIFRHAAELKTAEPAKKWRAAAGELVERVGRQPFRDAAARWLELGPSPGRPGVQIASGEADLEAGFVWLLAGDEDARLPPAVARFGEACLHKIPMLGAVSQKVGNACVNVLAELPGQGAVAQLSRLAQCVKYDTAQRLIDKALTRAAEKAGVTREQIEEMSVPDCGVGLDGELRAEFGEYAARVRVEETTRALVEWSDAQGKPLKSVPAAVKKEHGAEWKGFQRSVQEMEKMLAAHRKRIEGLLESQRAIAVETLLAHYLNHPLLAGMARRLIWQFDSGPGIWRDGRMTDDEERPIDLAAQKTARLWHPLSSDTQTVLHWRCLLEDRGIRQPFPQAHREVYLLTEAERQTATYSNRFAGHVLRQHVFAALAATRGWEFRLMGQWDSHNTPYKDLPGASLRMTWDVDFPRDESEVSGQMIYLLIRTGRARFVDATGAATRLEAVPPIVFSEAMRDLDLFTGVASIGSDASWGQRQPIPFGEYWNAFSFGALSEMAETRKTVLEGLLPHLAIADRCQMDGRFLAVRGDRARYRIHLGSGNVLMEPGSRYLCIVQGAATSASPASLALPFEGDAILSLILSKAFLLAADRKIKDESILRQLPR